MIEGNIVNWVNIGESLPNIDVYGKKKRITFFNLIRVLMGFKTFSVFFYILLKCFFFLQILMLTLTNINDTKDSAVMILKYISTVIFIQDIVKDGPTYQIAVLTTTILTVVTILCIVYLAISIKIGKFYLNLPIYFLNILNVIIMNYLIGPIVQIAILSTNCKPDGTHIYLKSKCFQDVFHIAIFAVSMLNLILFLLYSIVLSIYFNEIGSVNENKVSGRINCNYEIYMNISKILMFVFAYLMNNYGAESVKVLQLVLQLFILINSVFYAVYSHYTLLFYDNRMNIVTMNGWCYIAWFAFIIVLKSLLNIYDTAIFHIVGWIILTFIIYFIEEYKEEYLLTDFNIFEAKTLKEIELFNMKLYNLINIRSNKNQILLRGLIEKFERYLKTIPEMEEKYIKLSTNPILIKKFNSTLDLPVLSIVYIIYDYHLEKSSIKNDVLLAFSYFLMNKFKKVYSAILICSKVNVMEHKISYFKFILLEEIKEYLINKLTKSNNKESIKHVQIGSVILYNIYTDLFKMKILDAVCDQVDYFDILKNTTTTGKTTQNFLNLGKEILDLRKEILKLWDKLLELNPFSDDSERDYMLYLNTIMQDDALAKSELKKFVNLKNKKMSERNNIYHSMFVREVSTVILVNGYSSIGKILYVSPNFSTLFNFTGKEILNLSIEELIPNVVAQFHNELIENSVKYSNFSKIYSKQLDVLLKGKTGGIYNVKIFVKCIPNFSFGLIYMVYISKIQDHNFIIVLDKDFKINGLTDILSSTGANITLSNSNYGLTQSVIGHNIAMIIPDILMHIEYRHDEFVIPKTDIDLKGTLYPVSKLKEGDEKISNILEKIKKNGRLANEEEMKRETIQEFEELIKEITSKYAKSFSVFFRITMRTFLEGKYKYYRLYITNDLIALNENSHYYNSVKITNSESSFGRNGIKSKSGSRSFQSQKKIKLRGIGFDSEKKELLPDPKNTPNDLNAVDAKNDKKKNDNFLSQDASSSLTKSVDSASFNKLKNGILDKKEVTSIRAMKYFASAYGILTILLIYLSYLGANTTFSNTNKYLEENLFFNHTKIDLSCVYIVVTNLKWVKYLNEIIPEENCYFEKCSVLYPNILAECIVDMRTEKENSTFFYQDFKRILQQSLNIEIDIYQLEEKKTLSIDIENLLTYVISNGLHLNANTAVYFKEVNSVFDVIGSNLITQSQVLLNLPTLNGFDTVDKEENIKKQASVLNTVPLIIDVLLFVLLIISFSIILFNLNKMESTYLKKLIEFNSPGFEQYVKQLEDIKKKLRNDTGEDDDKLNDASFNGELNSKNEEKNKEGGENENNKDKTNNKKKEKEKAKNKNNKKNKKDDSKNKEKDQKALSKKKKKEKMTQQQRLKETKIKAMTGYFVRWNIFFTFKVMTVFVIALSYFIVLVVIDNIKKSNLLSFDSTVDSIEEIYKSSFDVFLIIKKTLAGYIDYEIEKLNAIQCLEDASCSYYYLDGKRIESYEHNKTYIENLPPKKMDIVMNEEITTPKLGNLLMPLINDKQLDKAQVNLLNTLYNGDSCSVLFVNTTQQYTSCSTFWSSILMKGMEQSITQMGVVINTVIDELNALNTAGSQYKEKLKSILSKTSAFSQYEFFVEYYFLQAYYKSVEIFLNLKNYKLSEIREVFLIILIVYIITVLILLITVLQLIYTSKKHFNSFLNFIGILPIKYIEEDPNLFNDLLKLEQKIF